MKLLLDAQLPRRLARELTAAGHDAVHPLDLLKGNRTPDDELTALAVHDTRVVVSKDADFETKPLPQIPLIDADNFRLSAVIRAIRGELLWVVSGIESSELNVGR